MSQGGYPGSSDGQSEAMQVSKAEFRTDVESAVMQEADAEAQMVVQNVVNEGFEKMPIENLPVSRLSQNPVCTSVAMNTGAMAGFFLAFQNFARAGCKMPDDAIQKQQEMDAIQQKAIDAYKGVFQFAVDYGNAITAVGSLPQSLEFMEAIVKQNFLKCEFCEGHGCDWKFCKQTGQTPRLKVCDACDGNGEISEDEDENGGGAKRKKCIPCGGKGKVPDTKNCAQCKGKGTIGVLKVECKKCKGVGKIDENTCNSCNGTGKEDSMTNCKKCKSKGKIQARTGPEETCDECYEGNVEDDNGKMSRCQWCRGKGRCKPWYDCEKCDGEGKKPELEKCDTCKGSGQTQIMADPKALIAAGNVDNVKKGLAMVQNGAQECLKKAFAIVKDALALQTEATAMKAAFDSQNQALKDLDQLNKELEDFLKKNQKAHAENISHLVQNEKIKDYKSKEETKLERLIEDENKKQHDRFDTLEKAFLENQQTGKERMQTLRDEWQSEQLKRIQKQDELIEKLTTIVKQGGYGVKKVGEKTKVETKHGWLWGQWEEERTVIGEVTVYEKLSEASDALSKAQHERDSLLKQKNPYDMASEVEPTVLDPARFIKKLPEEEQLEKVQAKICECEGLIAQYKKLINDYDVELAKKLENVATKRSEHKQKKDDMLKQLETNDAFAGQAIIKAFEAGLKFSDAASHMAYAQQTSPIGIQNFCNGVSGLFDTLAQAEDPVDQLRLLRNVMIILLDADKQAGLAVMFLQRVGPRYNPLQSLDTSPIGVD